MVFVSCVILCAIVTAAVAVLFVSGSIPHNILARLPEPLVVCIVRILVQLGASVNAKDKTGKTTLHCACARGHESVIRLLLELGAGVSTTRKRRGRKH